MRMLRLLLRVLLHNCMRGCCPPGLSILLLRLHWLLASLRGPPTTVIERVEVHVRGQRRITRPSLREVLLLLLQAL